MQSNRFQIGKTVGQGGNGIVYEAFDREREMTVALKTLRQTSANDIYRLKREFRRLRDVRHPNLIQFYDLVADDEHCFYTMEYFPGTDLRKYCRPDDDLCSLAQTRDASHGPARRAFDIERVRGSILQLTRALIWLHQAGFIHRDLKPGNVLVNAAGALKVLDFGLAISVSGTHPDTRGHGIVGTLGYLSPEQAVGTTEIGPATDWYSVGSILYELLTGDLPFTGNVAQVLVAKQTRSPAPILDAYGEGIPHFGDWTELCMGLLRKQPEDRLTGPDLLKVIDTGQSQTGESFSAPKILGPPPKPRTFVGRSHELAQLEAAFVVLLDGQQTTVVLEGGAGMGKTQLVREWIKRSLQRHPDLCVLNGRCYDRDTVSFRALDTVVDELTRVWRALPQGQAAAIMPRNVHWLADVFPVCQRIPAVEFSPRHAQCHDAAERRSLALEALRETLTRLADRVPLVILIDDFHWADADSICALNEVLAPPDGPNVLLVLVQTTDAEEHHAPQDLRAAAPWSRDEISPIGRRAPHPSSPGGRDRTKGVSIGDDIVIELGPLAFDESVRLLEDEIGQVDVATRLRLAGESQGVPETLELICRFGAEEASAFGDITVAGLTMARLGALSDESRRIVEVLALTTEPLPEAVLREVTNIAPEQFAQSFAWAADARFIHTTPDATGLGVELYGPSAREWILATVDPAARKSDHARLATVLGALSPPPFARMAHHFELAGDRARAAEAEAMAGRWAAEHESFDRAAHHYENAYRLGQSADATLLVHAGRCLAKANRHLSAARCFMAVSEQLRGDALGASARYRLVAAAHSLTAHAPQQASRQASAELAAMGIEFPSRKACSTFASRTKTNWHRLSAGRPAAAPTPPSAPTEGGDPSPTRAEMLAALAMAHAPLCLDRFEYFVARWLKAAATEGNVALHGQARLALAYVDARRGKGRYRDTLRKADASGPGSARLTLITEAACHGAAGDFKAAMRAFDAISNLGSEPEALAAAGALADVQPIAVLVLSGDLNGAHQRLRSAVRRARARESETVRYLLELGTASLLAVAVDRPDAIEHAIERILRQAPPREYPTVDAFRYIASVELSLYVGSEGVIWDSFSDGSVDIVALSPVLGAGVFFARARLLLAQMMRRPSAASPARSEIRTRERADIERIAAKLGSSDVPISKGYAALVAAAVIMAADSGEEARAPLERARAHFETCGAKLYVHLCNYLLLSLNDEDVELSHAVLHWTNQNQIVDPTRFLAAMMPWPERHHAVARHALARLTTATLRQRTVDIESVRTSAEADDMEPKTQRSPVIEDLSAHYDTAKDASSIDNAAHYPSSADLPPLRRSTRRARSGTRAKIGHAPQSNDDNLDRTGKGAR